MDAAEHYFQSLFASLLCHPQTTRLQGNAWICETCGATETLLHLVERADPYSTCAFAHRLARETGNIHIPCKIALRNVDGVRPEEFVVEYGNLTMGTRILGSLISENFVVWENCGFFDRNSSLNSTLLKKFLLHYVEVVESGTNTAEAAGSEELNAVVQNLLQKMREAFREDADAVGHYFDVLCPYVLSSPTSPPAKVEIDPITLESPMNLLDLVNARVADVRHVYGRRSVQFDLLFVMSYCFLSASSPRVLANVALDFAAKLCRGHYDSEFYADRAAAAESILAREFSPTRDMAAYHLVKRFRESEDYLDVSSLETFSRMHSTASKSLDKLLQRTDPTMSESVRRYAFSQVFPAVLFTAADRYYAFVCSFGYLSGCVDPKTGMLRKGSSARAKMAAEFVIEYWKRMKNFEPSYYDVDFLQVFLASDEQFINRMKQLAVALGGGE